MLLNIDDVRAYMRELHATGALYHWDDDPAGIAWAVPVDIAEMRANHDAVWNLCDPWQLIESDAEMAKLYNLGE